MYEVSTGTKRNFINTVLDKFDKCIVISDFDGTISTKDTNVEVQKVFGNEINKRIRADFNAGRIGIRDAMPLLYEQVKITEQEYNAFIDTQITVDPGFYLFQNKLAAAGVPLVIVSGGNYEAVVRILKNNSLDVPQIFANKFTFSGRDIKMEYLHKEISCTKSYGPCGNCKAKHIESLREIYDNIIFIGDGPTDRCAAELADYVFAKDKLAVYCRECGIPHFAYDDFNDIYRYFFEEVNLDV